MTNGASGDINNLVFTGTRLRSPFEQARIVASKAADTAWRAVKKIETYDDKPIVAVLEPEVDLPYRKPAKRKSFSPRVCSRKAQGKKRYQQPDHLGSQPGDRVFGSRPPRNRARSHSGSQNRGTGHRKHAEVLVEIGLEIKKKALERTFLISLANGATVPASA